MISAIILTKNEEGNIKRCMKSLTFCDEIIVIDDESTDQTIKIAKKLGAKVVKRKMNKNFAAQSNFGIAQAAHNWTLLIDADEVVSARLAKEIISTVKSPEYFAYEIHRKDYFFGKWLQHGETGNSRVKRLVKKGKGEWGRRVHPELTIKGKLGLLKNTLHHYPHKNMKEFINSINRWSSWHAISLDDEKKKSDLLKILLWPTGKFVQNYIFRNGFRDGTHGFIHAMIMSFHSFLAWSILYVAKNNK